MPSGTGSLVSSSCPISDKLQDALCDLDDEEREGEETYTSRVVPPEFEEEEEKAPEEAPPSYEESAAGDNFRVQVCFGKGVKFCDRRKYMFLGGGGVGKSSETASIVGDGRQAVFRLFRLLMSWRSRSSYNGRGMMC